MISLCVIGVYSSILGTSILLCLISLRDCMLSVKCPKWDFLKSSLHFLGHVISPSGVAPDPFKVAVIRDMPAPAQCLTLVFLLGMHEFL